MTTSAFSAFIGDRLKSCPSTLFAEVRIQQLAGVALQPQTRGPIDSSCRLRLCLPSLFRHPVVIGVRGEVQLCGLGDYFDSGTRGAAEQGRGMRVVEVMGLGGGCHEKFEEAIKIKSPEVVLNLFASASSSL